VKLSTERKQQATTVNLNILATCNRSRASKEQAKSKQRASKEQAKSKQRASKERL
jgi:hypothetical protein